MRERDYGELPRLVRAALSQYARINIREFAEAEFPYHSYQEINCVIQRIARLGELQRERRGVYRVTALFTRQRNNKRARKVPQETRDYAVRLYSAGWSQREIAKKLGISRGTVLSAVVEAGVRVRNRAEQRHTSRNFTLKLPKQLTLDI